MPSSLDPFWVIEDADYFTHLQNETNVTALDPTATLDIEPLWDSDSDGTPNPCEPVLLRSTSARDLRLHRVNLGAAFVDDLPGSLSDGKSYFYRIDERGGPTVTLQVEVRINEDTVRITFTP